MDTPVSATPIELYVTVKSAKDSKGELVVEINRVAEPMPNSHLFKHVKRLRLERSTRMINNLLVYMYMDQEVSPEDLKKLKGVLIPQVRKIVANDKTLHLALFGN